MDIVKKAFDEGKVIKDTIHNKYYTPKQFNNLAITQGIYDLSSVHEMRMNIQAAHIRLNIKLKELLLYEQSLTKRYNAQFLIEPGSGQGAICPRCGSFMTAREGLHGKFWGCITYPICNGTLNYIERRRNNNG